MRSVLLAMLLLAVSASSATAQSGTVNVTRAPGNAGLVVDDLSQISCGLDCAGTYAYECEPNPNPPGPDLCTPQSVTLTSSTANGFAPDGFTNCPGSTTSECTVFATAGPNGTNVTANFVDIQAPVIAFGGPPAGKVAGTINFNTNPSDNAGVTRVEFRLNSALIGGEPDTNAPYVASLDTTLYPDGTNYTVTQRAFDAANNASATVSRTYTFDNSVNGDFGPNTPAQNSTIVVQPVPLDYTTDPDATATCRVDGAPVGFGACASSYNLADGVHNFEVRFTDDVGNSKTIARTFKVDRTAPTLTVTAPTGFVNATTVTPTVQTEDAGGSAPTLACSIDGGAFGSCTDIPVSEGPHTIRVRSTDNVGNARTADSSFTVDRTLPEITVTTSGSGGVLEVEWTANDATALTFACRIDDGPFESCTSGIQYQGLSAGLHTVTVRATDAAGNSRSQSKGFMVSSGGTVTTPPGGSNPPPATGGAALPTRPKITAPSKLALKKAKRKLRITVATTVPGCRLRLIKTGRVKPYVSRKILKAGTTKLTITLDRRMKPGTYVLTLKCGSKTAKRRLRLTR